MLMCTRNWSRLFLYTVRCTIVSLCSSASFMRPTVQPMRRLFGAGLRYTVGRRDLARSSFRVFVCCKIIRVSSEPTSHGTRPPSCLPRDVLLHSGSRALDCFQSDMLPGEIDPGRTLLVGCNRYRSHGPRPKSRHSCQVPVSCPVPCAVTMAGRRHAFMLPRKKPQTQLPRRDSSWHHDSRAMQARPNIAQSRC